jgi:hypothetical protein
MHENEDFASPITAFSDRKAQNANVEYNIRFLNNSVALEPEGSSPYSQEPATGSYPEPTGYNLHSSSQSP